LLRELKLVAWPGFHTHLLRHTFVSVMENELECPRRIVAQIAGKARKGEMDRYSSSYSARRQVWADKYAALILSDLSLTTTTTPRFPKRTRIRSQSRLPSSRESSKAWPTASKGCRSAESERSLFPGLKDTVRWEASRTSQPMLTLFST